MTAKSGKASGVLLLDKPCGMTSNAALQAVRRLYDKAKAGHTGTLDPMATGLLPVCLGQATKFSQSLLEACKSYDATLRLGWRSDTGDAEGELSRVAAPCFSDEDLAAAVQLFTGEIEQVPPMYSAIKVNGEPLYARARRGEHVERASRRVHIYQLKVLRQSADQLDIAVTCSKGTYIRTLAEDLGERLGCGAYLGALRRVAIGSIKVADAVTLEQLETLAMPQRLALLKPIDLLLDGLPGVTVAMADSRRLGNGLCVAGVAGPGADQVRVYDEAGCFLGLGALGEDGVLRPRRWLAAAS